MAIKWDKAVKCEINNKMLKTLGKVWKGIKNMIKEVKVLKVREGAIIPQRATKGSAGMDVHACIKESETIKPGELKMIPSGISISLPEGYTAFLFARSGLGVKHGISLSNGVGVIDNDYRGEINVGLCNISKENYTINPNERIAQIVILKTENFVFNKVSDLDVTERGENGFGSTGK